jgi:hypothetical protein
MAIDVSTEKLISLAEYTKLRPLGRNQRPMSLATAYRHVYRGVRGFRLEHVRFGGNNLTSVEAVQRFVERLTAEGEPAPDVRPPAARRRAIEAADRDLDALGA